MNRWGTRSFVASGFALIAVAYGLARFAYGLFLPALAAELGLGPTEAGWIGSGAFAAYCVATAAAALLCVRIGARRTLLLAGAVAAVGMAGIAASQDAAMLAVSVTFAGLSPGLASPPLALAVSERIEPVQQGAANTLINSGTSAGVVLSGPVALVLAEAWREAYWLFALLSFGVTVWLCYSMPPVAAAKGRAEPKPFREYMRHRVLMPVLLTSALMGVSSTAIWTFGGAILSDHAGWTDTRIAGVWIVIGASGVAGAAAGPLIRRFGLNEVHRASLAAIACSILLLSIPGGGLIWGFGSAVLFGAAYIMMTGVILVWGVEAVPEYPAFGLGAGFLSIAAGQVAGAPVFGYLYESAGVVPALLTFSALACLPMAIKRV
ncbi:MFS transporter [Nisaea acidiphila]|uniref:MFS transporter n=1 Tax=Nisaea acidiphila TaxID=1862145 RepID=A0A9J7AQB4_9PROT|nr:MFS transporter [Nisaea acidiphila]UUX49592.1 MFS transporter [Nisaea acidiphila]